MTRRGLDPRRLLLVVLAVGLAVRVAHLLLDRGNPFFQPTLLDARYYDRWARRILGGDVLTTGVFYGLPLYPYFLALCYALTGGSVVAVKVVQIALGLLSIVITYATGALLADATVGLVAAALAAVYGPLVFHESMLIPEAIGVPLYAGAFRRAVELKPHFAQAHDDLGIIYARRGQTERAIDSFRTALRFDPWSCLAATNLGHALELAGRLEEARGEWRQAVERDPSCDGAKRALGPP